MILKDVIIPAAGLGTRMYPITNGKISKLLLKINNKPIIDYAIEEAIKSQLKNIHVIVKDKESDIFKYLKESEYSNKINIIQQFELKGVAHAILQAENNITNDFFSFIYPDILFISETPAISQLIDYFKKFKSNLYGYVNLNSNDLRYFSTPNYIITENINNKLKVKDIVLDTYSLNPKKIKIPFRSIYSTDYFKHAKISTYQYSDSAILKSLIKNVPIFCQELNGQIYDTGNPAGYLKAQHKLESNYR